MITEDYVSFDTAKLLKEKGTPLPSAYFRDWLCCMYDENGDIQWGCYHPNWYARVTLQMAMKWLRKKHNLEIYPYHNSPNNRHNSGWWFEIIKYPNSVAEYESGKDEEFDTYEEACEAAIKYCLEKLI